MKHARDCDPWRYDVDRPSHEAQLWRSYIEDLAEVLIDAVERYGLERMIVDASGDWGPSDPATLHDTLFTMKQRGHRIEDVETLFYNNPCFFLGQCDKFKPEPTRSIEEAW